MPLSVARWTSALQLRGREFCFILNRAVRGDEPPLADPTAGLSRGINKLCVSVPPRPPFPPGDVCLRGGGFDDRYRRCATAYLVPRSPLCGQSSSSCVCSKSLVVHLTLFVERVVYVFFVRHSTLSL